MSLKLPKNRVTANAVSRFFIMFSDRRHAFGLINIILFIIFRFALGRFNIEIEFI